MLSNALDFLGMMVNICAYQLIPTAHKYDPEDTVVSHSILVGMMIMAMSLVIFLY
jgi:ZIP family zinc transporter